MRERLREKIRGLYISMPGLVTGGFLDQLAIAGQQLPERPFDLPTKTARANGSEFHYFEFGHGEPVVFVHGSIGDYRTWGYQFEPFSANYRVISYSRRYHYPNVWAGDGSDYTTGLHANDLAAFIRTLECGPAHIVGQSSGASIAALCASKHPDVTRTLVVDEPDFFPWLPELDGGKAALDDYVKSVDAPASRALAAGDAELAIQLFVDGILGAGNYQRLTPEMRIVMLDNVPELKAELKCSDIYYSPFTFDDARNIRAPTLLFEGSLRLPVFRLCGDKFAECVPNITRVTADGSPHAAHFVTPDQFNEIVLKFLDHNAGR